MICSVCAPVLYLASPGTRTAQPKPAVAFLLKMSEGHFGAGSLPLPSSETAHGQKQCGFWELRAPGRQGIVRLRSCKRAGEAARGGCKCCVSAVTFLRGDMGGMGEKWSLGATCSSKWLIELPPYNVSKASWTSLSRNVTPETELLSSPPCTELNISKAGFAPPSRFYRQVLWPTQLTPVLIPTTLVALAGS